MALLETEGIDEKKEHHTYREISEYNSVFLDATKDTSAFTNIGIDEKSFYVAKGEDQSCMDIPNFIKIHELRHYKLSLDYKCEKDCTLQFYVKCFDINFTEIETFHIARIGEAVIIKGVDTDYKTIKCEGDLSQWTPTTSICSDRIIGFNYNALNIYDKVIADDYIKYNKGWNNNDQNAGAYCYIDNKSKIIKLSLEIPENIMKKIIPNETVIRNHLWGSTTTYLSVFHNDNVVKDNKWHASEHIFKGVSKIMGPYKWDENNKFRKGTKYIKLGIRRYGKSNGSVWFNHVKLEQVKIQ